MPPRAYRRGPATLATECSACTKVVRRALPQTVESPSAGTAPLRLRVDVGAGRSQHRTVDAVVLLGLLVLGVVVLTPVADRIGVPQPVLLTVFGIALGFLPGVPAPDLPPDLILPLVLPPLLFAATQATSMRELRAAARPILILAIGLTIGTAALVTVVAHALGVPWAVAAVLGAVVSPPDPVAASAVAGRLRLPARLVTILEGEGKFNDATALVLYQLSVMAVIAGGVTVAQVGLGLLVAVIGGGAIGLAGGWGGRPAAGRRARRAGSALPYGWREATVAAWAGMRGVVTVATALALPETAQGDSPFPFREEVVLVALLVVIVTLVLQGLTLAPVIRWLGVAETGDARADARILQQMVTEAALEHIRRADDVPEEV